MKQIKKIEFKLIKEEVSKEYDRDGRTLITTSERYPNDLEREKVIVNKINEIIQSLNTLNEYVKIKQDEKML